MRGHIARFQGYNDWQNNTITWKRASSTFFRQQFGYGLMKNPNRDSCSLWLYCISLVACCFTIRFSVQKNPVIHRKIHRKRPNLTIRILNFLVNLRFGQVWTVLSIPGTLVLGPNLRFSKQHYSVVFCQWRVLIVTPAYSSPHWFRFSHSDILFIWLLSNSFENRRLCSSCKNKLPPNHFRF